ncbi:MAG: DUF4330 domain-containing protein [Clostridia bacterium]|nr:DUF4330 domain-containing protein [Clostridia bacterium]
MNKSRKRINIVDIVVFAVIIIAIAYAAYAIVVNMRESGGDAVIEYVVEIPQIRDELAEKASEGETVYNLRGEAMGEVRAVSVSQAYYQGSNTQGTTVYSKIEGYSSMYITMVCSADVTPYGYELNGEKIAAGSMFQLRTPSLYFEGECVSVRLSEQ